MLDSSSLAAQPLTPPPTDALDFFPGPGRGDVSTARDAFEAAASSRRWSVRRLKDTPTFCRLAVSGPDDLLVDLALDAPPTLPPTRSVAGPTFGLEELAGRKVIALVDRAEARDFVDLNDPARRYDKPLLLTRAGQVDAGFDLAVFAEMLRTLSRFADDDLPVGADEVQALREFFVVWAAELSA